MREYVINSYGREISEYKYQIVAFKYEALLNWVNNEREDS